MVVAVAAVVAVVVAARRNTTAIRPSRGMNGSGARRGISRNVFALSRMTSNHHIVGRMNFPVSHPAVRCAFNHRVPKLLAQPVISVVGDSSCISPHLLALYVVVVSQPGVVQQASGCVALRRCTGDMGVACPPELLAIACHAPVPLANTACISDACYSVLRDKFAGRVQAQTVGSP